jgi:hypothetical protein
MESSSSGSASTAFVFHDDDQGSAARGGSCCSVTVHRDGDSSDNDQQEVELVYSPPKQQQQQQQAHVAPLSFDDSESDIEPSSPQEVTAAYRNKMTFAEAKQSLALIRKTHSPNLASSPPPQASSNFTNATAFPMPPARTMLAIEIGDLQHPRSDNTTTINSKTNYTSSWTTSTANDDGEYSTIPKSKLAMEIRNLQRMAGIESATKADLQRLLDIQSARTANERNSGNSRRQQQPLQNLVESCQQQQQHEYHYNGMEEYPPSLQGSF